MRAKLDSQRDMSVVAAADALLSEAHAIAAEDVRLNRTMGERGASPHSMPTSPYSLPNSPEAERSFPAQGCRLVYSPKK